MSRSIVINMRRQNAQSLESLQRFDEDDVVDLDNVYSHVVHWIKDASLNLNPEMPAGVHGRTADNWRPLIAIADACGPAWSVLAREAAIALARSDHDEDVAVLLLWHAREVFDARDVDRLSSKEVIRDLIALESADGMWGEYRGPTGNERPRRLTQNALARLLRPFGIKPRVLWPPQRTSASKSARGYHRNDFEAAWASYCDGADTPSQDRRLHIVEGGAS
jgi:hypothetical protein